MKEIEPLPNDVMSYKGLSAYLKMSQGTLRQKVMRGKIPFFKIDGAVRFSKVKIDAWLEEHHKNMNRKQAGDNGELFTANEGGEV